MPPLAAIPPPPFSFFEIGPLTVRMYGLLIAVGAYLALLLVVRRYERFGGDPGVAEKTALLAIGGGLLGARIGYVIPRFLGDGGYFYDPIGIIAIWRGGLAFFGGLVGGTLAVIVYLRVKDLRLPAIADAVAPALPLAQAFGRWGNYFNQELFGRPTDVPWALEVDPGRVPDRYVGETTFHPTFLYESLWNLMLVGVILLIDRMGWLKRRGSLMFVYLIGYGLGRGWIETLRVDTVERYFGWSRNNWIALLVVIIGVVGLLWWERRPDGPTTQEGDLSGVGRVDPDVDGTTPAERDVEGDPEAGDDLDTGDDLETGDDPATADGPAPADDTANDGDPATSGDAGAPERAETDQGITRRPENR